MVSSTEKECPHITKKYYKKGICQLRVTDDDGREIKAEEGDGVVRMCLMNDSMCLLEFGFECDTYQKWLKGMGS